MRVGVGIAATGTSKPSPDLSTLCRHELASRAPRCASPISSGRTASRRRLPAPGPPPQLDRLAERGWAAYAGTELEFIVFEDSYEAAWDGAYRG